MKPINAEEIVRVFNGWLNEADSLAEREAIECCMSDDGMFCPYKKSTKREVSYSWISRTEITTERFGWCSEKKCMAYNNGRCKILEGEIAHE